MAIVGSHGVYNDSMRTNDDTELPKVHRPSFETALTFAEQEVEDFLEPLVYVWDEERYIVSEAIRRYLALFNADQTTACV